MQKHTQIYMNFFGFKIAEDCMCEIPDCSHFTTDIHHIEPRSKFGTKREDERDHISNLIGLCRYHHSAAHSELLTKDKLKEIHLNYMKNNGKHVD